MEVVVGLTDGFVHASAVVVLTFCQCEMTRGKIVLDGKSKENLEKVFGIQFFFQVFLQTLAPVFGNKLVRFLRKISHGFWGNAIRHRL